MQRTWIVVYWYVDPWTAEFDEMRESKFVADTKEAALAQFVEDHGKGHVIQCVYEEES